MVLSRENKEKLRREILQQLDNIAVNEKIHFDKNLLEELIFETIVFDNSRLILKLPVWTGTFLRKIDLSEISFEDVSWSLLSNLDYGVLSCHFDNSVLEKIEEAKSINNGKVIDFSYTNANIDFEKSYEAKKSRGIEIRSCDFSGVDLSNNTTKNIIFAHQVNFANTNLKILDKKSLWWFVECNLENLDLSNFKVSGLDLIDFGIMPSKFSLCNLKNTGINIYISDSMFDESYEGKKIGLSSDDIKQIFFEYVSNGNIDNCILNKEKIESKSRVIK